MEQIWVLVCLLTVKTNRSTGTIYVTQGSVLREMSCGCHSHFKMEVKDFDRKKAETKRDHRGELVRSVTVSNGWKQRSKIIRD